MDRTSLSEHESDRLRRLEVFLQDSNDAILVLDSQDRIVEWNRGAERTYGYTEEEALGMNVRALLPRERASELQGLRTRLADRQVVEQYETQRVTKDGRLLYVITTPTLLPSKYGEEPSIAITDRDITERRQHEQTLRYREELTRAIVEAAVDAIITIDPSGVIESANPAVERLFGYSVEELLGNNVSMLMPAPQREEHDGYLRRYLLTGVKKIIGAGREVAGRRKDGSLFPMELAISEVILAGQYRFTGILRDITERKQTERDLRNQAAHLEAASANYQQASIVAVAATKAKSEFLANMSHEIRTPLSAILGYTEILEEEDISREEHQEAVQALRRNGEHLLAIINDLLDLSRIEAGKVDLEMSYCSPVEIVQDVVELLQVRARQKGLSLQIHQDEAHKIPEQIYTAPVRMRQILINLVGNAIKFTDAGVVRLVLGVHASPSDLSPSKLQLLIDVMDTGIGISKEQAALLFQPFTQVDSSASRRFSGTGLGLSLSRRMAQLLGGDIELVHSAPGQGSQFRLRLEIDKEVPVAAERSLAQRVSLAPQDLRVSYDVLVADDGRDNRLLVSRTLSRMGAKVTVVEDGKQAVAAVLAAQQQGRGYKVVLMDMQMPVMDGYEASRELRQQGFHGTIIALTAHSLSGDRDRCLSAGCDAYLSKPLRAKELREVLQKTVRLSD